MFAINFMGFNENFIGFNEDTLIHIYIYIIYYIYIYLMNYEAYHGYFGMELKPLDIQVNVAWKNVRMTPGF